jgi:PAS domain S-box-containing protein
MKNPKPQMAALLKKVATLRLRVAELEHHQVQHQRTAESLHREHLEELVAARTAELETKNQLFEAEIGERERVEFALRKSEEKFSKMFHACPIAMCFVSLKDRRFIEINRAYEEATGYSQAEVIGRTPMDFTLWTEPEKLEWVFHKVVTEGSYRDFEGVFRTKAGELKIGLLSAEIIEFAGERCMLTAA